MDSFYFIIVLALILLAISDLIVGVSNDAVNFLNSAYGSRAAKKKTILIVAASGILIGTLSSSGMMEIARKGIFNPEMFSFADIMTIFLAVMITDILLLDLFNTFGMPTSTTVSIMFELLGAAFCVASIKILRQSGSFSELGSYLNGSNAMLIISGIFLSILLAFSIGFFVQFVSRLIFSFNLNKSMKRYAPVFGGLALTIILFFLLIKGLKGSAFMPDALSETVARNTGIILTFLFVSTTAVCFGLTYLFKVNVLKVVVLFGTFSLAMAFAGNDLVNFIGVPLAGLQAYGIFQGANIPAEQLNMGVLGDPVQTSTWLLLGAGIVMIGTLWFSKKAQTVTETEINLASQSESSERFKTNLLARLIVKGGIASGRFGNRFVPKRVRTTWDSKFSKATGSPINKTDQPAFDMVRASVNLMTASVLIALATSLKLPLSTTYVSFMVAMGTSLADKAWSRDTAVYRVAGVLHVVGGWLITAAFAFFGAGLLALVIFYGEMIAIIGLLVLTALLMIRSQIHHKKTISKKTSIAEIALKTTIKGTEVLDESKYRISITLFKVSCILKDSILGLESEDVKVIQKAKIEVKKYQVESVDLKTSFYYYLQKIDSDRGQEGQFYIHAVNYIQQISESVFNLSEAIFTHVQNLHQPVRSEKMASLKELSDKTSVFLVEFSDLILTEKRNGMASIRTQNAALLYLIDQLEKEHIIHVRNDKSSPKNSLLYFSILLEYRNILSNITGLLGLFEGLNQPEPPQKPTEQKRSKVLN